MAATILRGRSGHAALWVLNGEVLVTGGAVSTQGGVTNSAAVSGTDGLLTVAGGRNQTSAELYGFAILKTDQTDYSPVEVVTITGSGWRPGESVTLSFREYPTLDAPGPFTVTADASGNIYDAEFAPDAQDIGTRFFLTAVGASSGMQAEHVYRTKDPALVREAMGHESLSTTMKYMHPDLDRLRGIIDARNERVM